MSAANVDEKGVVTRCPNCQKQNRILYKNISSAARCGDCRTDIPPLHTSVDVGREDLFELAIKSFPVPVLVDFWAAWCGPCKMVAPELEKVAEATAGQLVVLKVNTEDLPYTAQRLNIASLPTMAVYLGGREMGRKSGAMPADGIMKFIEQTLFK